MLLAVTSQLIGKHQVRKMDFSITCDENGLEKFFPAVGKVFFIAAGAICEK